MAIAQRRAVKDIGQAVLGFGLMFLGLKLILDGVDPLQTHPLAAQTLAALADNALVGVLGGAVFSALVTSSAATIGLTLALAHEGLLHLPGAIAIVLGANIGTCATALMAAVGTSAEAKRVAAAHIAFGSGFGVGRLIFCSASFTSGILGGSGSLGGVTFTLGGGGGCVGNISSVCSYLCCSSTCRAVMPI